MIQSSADFDGEIVFTSALGGQSWDVTLPLDQALSVPGVAPQRLVVAGSGLACAGADDCDPSEVIAQVLAAHGSL